MVTTSHLLGIRQLPASEIEALLELGAEFRDLVLTGKPIPKISNKVLGMLFFENSTRTRVSFEQAAHYLGLKTANFMAGASSMNKGETLKDTILTLRFERLDGLVMRHRQSGAPALAARFFGGPVVNAGDGQHEHPTQALGDALTVLQRKGRISGLKVAIVGDVLHSRVARSNAWLFSKLGAEVRFVGPKTLMPSHMGMLPGRAYYELISGLDGADVVMCLRLQKERMADGLLSSVNEYARLYQVTERVLDLAAPDCLVMHPGPINRGIELDDGAADSDRSVIRAQIENGIFVRMAVLHRCFGQPTPAKRARAKAVAK
ncbi:MAG: aspartate carbamoyltransferase catalytic subunit [Fimbriimonadaceae bacterium]